MDSRYSTAEPPAPTPVPDRRRRRALLAACLVGVGVLLFVFLFRTRTIDNEYWGVMRYHWRWGRARLLTVDVNRDGVVDARSVYPADGDPLTDYDPPLRNEHHWFSSRCDGVFDLHTPPAPSQLAPYRLEMDRDRDGSYETVLEGEEVQRFWREVGGCWQGKS